MLLSPSKMKELESIKEEDEEKYDRADTKPIPESYEIPEEDSDLENTVKSK